MLSRDVHRSESIVSYLYHKTDTGIIEMTDKQYF